MKRIVLLILMNLLVVMTISTLLSVLGVEPYLQSTGLNLPSLAIFCLIWGFGGALISLGMSRWMAKTMMGVQLIDPNQANGSEKWLLETVHQFAKNSGIEKMPEVGIYHSPDLNAFATGPSKNKSLVAVSTGLLERMNQKEIEGVLGHEIAHIANGDMVTMTLLQGVINSFVMFFARIIAFAIAQARSRSDEDSGEVGLGFSYHITVFVLEMIFMILGSMVLAWFSRQREFRADQGGASLAGKNKMIEALRALQKNIEIGANESSPEAFRALQISSKKGSFLSLLSTHPSLEDRIAALETQK